MEDPQMIKGILEGCVLSVIAQEETYGYRILEMLSEKGFRSLQEGTLYPILTRLEARGALACRKEKSPLGPIRKYYSITPEGRAELNAFRTNFLALSQTVTQILSEKENQDQ